MKRAKRFLACLLSWALILAFIPQMQVYAAKTVDSGKSGFINWKVDSNGVLTLKGKGEAYKNYNYNGEPCYEWIRYNDKIKKVVVNISGIKDATALFYKLSSAKSIDLKNFDTSKVTNMSDMFHGCESLTKVDVSRFNTKKTTAMMNMFEDCKNLTSLNLSSFDTSNVTNMSYMFSGCEKLKNVDLSSFDTGKVTSMNRMFYNCSSLTNLDLSGFDTRQLAGMEEMFAHCPKLSTTITLVKIPTSCKGMFVEAATANRAKITLNYGGEYTQEMANDFIGVTDEATNIQTGKLVDLKYQKISAKVTDKTLKYSSLKKANQTFNIGAKAKTGLKYKVVLGSKYVSVSSKGKVTVKKGTPKGAYRILITAKGTSKYHSAVKHITILVK